MSSGTKPSSAYSGLIQPALGLLRFTSAMIAVPAAALARIAPTNPRQASTPVASSARARITPSGSRAFWPSTRPRVSRMIACSVSIVGPIVVATSPASAWAVSAAGRAGATASDPALADPSSRLWAVGNLIAAAVIFAVLWWRGLLRLKALTSGGVRNVDAQPAWVWACGAALVFFSSVLAAAAAAQISGVPTGLFFGSPRALAIIQLSSYGAALLAVVFLLRLLKDAAPKAGLTITTRSLTLGLFAGLLTWPIVTTVGNAALWVQTTITHTQPDPLGHPLLKVLRDHPDSVWSWALGACAVLGAPIIEETLYRGLIQSFVLRVTGMPWASVLISSAIFALMHVDPEGGIPWAALVEIGVFGLILGIMFERTKRLGVPIAMHVLFNAGNLALAMLAS